MHKRIYANIIIIVLLLLLQGCLDSGARIENIIPVVSKTNSYNNRVYHGITSIIDDNTPIIYDDVKFSLEEPLMKSFRADAFFKIKGKWIGIKEDNSLILTIKKDGTDIFDFYWLSGDFDKDIWLKFGRGHYTIKIFEITIISNNINYTGDITNWKYNEKHPICQYEVYNTNNEVGEFFYPSEYIQSDNERILKKTGEILHGVSNDREKVKKINDYVMERLKYDNNSLMQGYRKKQDAVTAEKTRVAVCEGYTSLMNAMLRCAGLRSKSIEGYGILNGISTSHAWTNVEVEGKWYLVDSTWNDTGQGKETYLLLEDLTGIDNDHKYRNDRPNRSNRK